MASSSGADLVALLCLLVLLLTATAAAAIPEATTDGYDTN